MANKTKPSHSRHDLRRDKLQRESKSGTIYFVWITWQKALVTGSSSCTNDRHFPPFGKGGKGGFGLGSSLAGPVFDLGHTGPHFCEFLKKTLDNTPSLHYHIPATSIASSFRRRSPQRATRVGSKGKSSPGICLARFVLSDF